MHCTPPWVPRSQKSSTLLVGEPRAIKGSFFPKPAVGQNVALDAVSADRASNCLVSAVPIYSIFFFFFLLLQIQSATVDCVLNSESEFDVRLATMHVVSPWHDPARLTGRKISSIYLSLWMILLLLASEKCLWNHVFEELSECLHCVDVVADCIV